MVHSHFRRETFENDVALFELKSAVRYSLYIQPACLLPAALVQPLENSSDCYISGWGRTAEKGNGLTPRPHIGVTPTAAAQILKLPLLFLTFQGGMAPK